MENEQGKTLEALNIAMKMEIDGKQYYLKASQSSKNPLGVKLFQVLAKEEADHLKRFENIFKSIQENKGWTQVDIKFHPIPDFKTLFTEATKDIESTSTELDAVQTAMTMENKTRDYYLSQSKLASFEIEKKYYDTLAGEEEAHHSALLDYFEYLRNPGDWFTMRERHSLDGG